MRAQIVIQFDLWSEMTDRPHAPALSLLEDVTLVLETKGLTHLDVHRRENRGER